MKYKRNMVGIPPHPDQLTVEILKRLGFKKAKDIIDRDVWRISPSMYYSPMIQVSLGNYPRTNPNCGIVSIYHPKEKATGFTNKGKKKIVTFKESEWPIAWGVDTYTRLEKIITSLTQRNL